MSVTIRPLAPGDKARWRALFAAYVAFYKSHVADEVVEITWGRLLGDDPHDPNGLVAVDATGEVVGIAHYLLHRSTWSPTRYCYLEDLFVEPARRAKGIGRALIEAVYEAADQAGCTRTYWVTQEFNYRARGLYDQVAVKSPFIQYRRPV